MMLVNNQSTMGEELTRRVQESGEKGNFDTIANFELLMKPASEMHNEAREGEIYAISDVGSAVSSPALHKMFFCYMEEPGIIVSAWIPIIVIITENRWMHIFPFTHDHDVHHKPDACFVKFAASQKLFFEEDLTKHISPLLSADKAGQQQMKTMNALLKKLDDHITLEDIEEAKMEQVNRYVK